MTAWRGSGKSKQRDENSKQKLRGYARNQTTVSEVKHNFAGFISIAKERIRGLNMGQQKLSKLKYKTKQSESKQENIQEVCQYQRCNTGACMHVCMYVCIYVCLFRAVPMTYGSPQARGWIGTVVASLCHSHTTLDTNPFCNLYHSSQQGQILNPLSKA